TRAGGCCRANQTARSSDAEIALAPDLPVLDLARIDPASDDAPLVPNARRWNRRVGLDRRRGRHDCVEALLHAWLELGVAEDEQVVVHDPVQYAPARLERVHADGPAPVLEAPRDFGRQRVGLELRGTVRILFARPDVVVRVDTAGAEHRGADARRLELDAQRFHHADGRDLRGGVDAGVDAWQQAAHRGGGHEMTALAVLQHVRQTHRDAVEDRREIDRDGVVPFLVAGLARLSERLDASVVHDEMELPVLALDLLEHLSPAIGVGHVVPDRQHTGITGLEEGQRRFQSLGIAVADADLHAGEGGGARDTESDPVGGGRDIGDLPFEVLERRRLRELRFRRESWRTAGLWRAGLGCRSG